MEILLLNKKSIGDTYGFFVDRVTFRALREVSGLGVELGAVEEDSLELAVFLTFSYTKNLRKRPLRE